MIKKIIAQIHGMRSLHTSMYYAEKIDGLPCGTLLSLLKEEELKIIKIYGQPDHVSQLRDIKLRFNKRDKKWLEYTSRSMYNLILKMLM